METLLFLSDYRIIEATNARGVIDRARRLRPRVLVMPGSLPGMDPGGGAIGVLKEDPAMRDLKVILHTAPDDLRGERVARELDVDVVIHEPCMPSEIVTQVRRCVTAAVRAPFDPGATRRDASSREHVRGPKVTL